ncbi:MAG: class I SAM-dependent methyltransferase [Caldilineaceae bacterium]
MKNNLPLSNASASPTYAHGYDSAMTVKMHARRTVEVQGRFFLPYLQPGMRLLDCGCGSGSITRGLARIVAPGEVVGIDMAASEIERACADTLRENVTNVRFEVGNLYKLAFPDACFDALFCHNVLEHLNDPGKALSEMRRVLKPEGVIAVRDADNGGDLLQPEEALLLEWFVLLEADWRIVGGNPRIARALPWVIRQAGFASITSSASYDIYCDREGVQLIAEVAARRCQEMDAVQRILEHKLADPAKLTAMHDAWLAWAERPDAFFAHAHVEVVGWKA